MTFGEALKVHQQNQADDLTLKWATRHYWNQIFIRSLEKLAGVGGSGNLTRYENGL